MRGSSLYPAGSPPRPGTRADGKDRTPREKLNPAAGSGAAFPPSPGRPTKEETAMSAAGEEQNWLVPSWGARGVPVTCTRRARNAVGDCGSLQLTQTAHRILGAI